MTRREFLPLLGAPLAAKAAPFPSILVHEHVLVDFIGADRTSRDRWKEKEVIALVKPYLEEVKRLGCRRFQDCTPNFIGRDAKLLEKLSDAAGLEIWTNTGLYAAAQDFKFLPKFAHDETASQLAVRWVNEARRGIDGVKPRFIKIGVSGVSPLHPLDRKIVEAAAITSAETGFTIASHTTSGAAALEELDLITGRGVKASKFVWVHAQNEKDQAIQEQVARAGAWVELDGIGPKTARWHLECVMNLVAKGLGERVLISQDAGWYRAGEPGGAPEQFRGYAYIYTDFIAGMEQKLARQLLEHNPVKAFG